MLLFRQRNHGSIKLFRFLSVAIDGQDNQGKGVVSAYMEDKAMRNVLFRTSYYLICNNLSLYLESRVVNEFDEIIKTN